MGGLTILSSLVNSDLPSRIRADEIYNEPRRVGVCGGTAEGAAQRHR